MTEPPPPTEPPAGWYPDPEGGAGHRWWDGSDWSEHRAPGQSADPGVVQAAVGPAGPAGDGSAFDGPPAPTSASVPDWGPAGPPPPPGGQVMAPAWSGGSGGPPPGGVGAAVLTSIGDWLSESLRLTFGRFGHYLPLVLFFVLTTSVATSVAVFFGLEDTIVEVAESGTADVDYGGSVGALYAALGFVALSMVLVPLVKASVVYQVVAARAEKPEAWSRSLNRAVGRFGRIVGASLARTGIYWSLLVVSFIAIGIAPVLILTLPIVIGLLVFAWYRLSMVGIIAALGASEDKPFLQSWRMTSRSPAPLLGRMLLLAVVAFNLILAANFLLAPLILLVSAGPPPATNSDTIILRDQLGPTAAMAALRSFVNGFGLGLNYILAAVGTTLLYLNLGGPVSVPVGEEETETAGGFDRGDGTGTGGSSSGL